MTRDSASAKLESLRRQVRADVRDSRAVAKQVDARWSGVSVASVAIGALKFAAMIVFPFLLYVRASVFLSSQIGGAPWIAVAGALAITVGSVAIFATWVAKRLSASTRFATLARWIAAPMAAGWLLYSLLFLARVNAKTDDVRAYYASLHPVLRVAVSTAIVVDPGVVITDMQRQADDYRRMGLPVNDRTRHCVQADGWVQAVDLRTLGHGELRNRSLQFYFWLMGFSTLRHVGTADHLHVQTP